MSENYPQDVVEKDELYREIVVPGEYLGEAPLKSGFGTYIRGGRIYAAVLGFVQRKAGYINVIPLEGKYMPKKDDLVIAKCIDVSGTLWIVDINSPFECLLLPMEVPWNVEFGDTQRYINIGDVLLLRVKDIDDRGQPLLTMKGEGLRKLRGGHLIQVSAVKVPRIIGKGGSMIKMIKNYTRCQIIVGKNGYIWINGDIENTFLAEETMYIIEREAQKIGLTNYIEQFLKSRSKTLINTDLRE